MDSLKLHKWDVMWCETSYLPAVYQPQASWSWSSYADYLQSLGETGMLHERYDIPIYLSRKLGTPKFHLSTFHSCFLNEQYHMSSHILPLYQPHQATPSQSWVLPSHTQPYPAIFGGTNDGRRLPTILDHGRIGYPLVVPESTLWK